MNNRKKLLRGKEIHIQQVLIIYFIMVCVYGIFVHIFGSPVYRRVDEQLYISMARSFFYEHNFAVGGELKNYGSVLYSMLISIAYFFYSPEKIVLYMRLIGVIVSSSVVFPVYLIAKKLELKANDLWLVCIFSVIVPEMMMCVYMMQEVLLYPLFMWTVYFILCDSESEKNTKWSILSAVFLALCYFTKTSALAFTAGYFAVLLLEIVQRIKNKERDPKQRIIKLITEAVIFIVLLVMEKYFIILCNGGVTGNNHYESQFQALFPIDMQLVLQVVIGILFYLAFSFFSMGGGLVIKVYEQGRKKNGQFQRVMFSMFVMVILQTVVCILCTENRGNLLPNKFLFRYIYCLFIPFVCCYFAEKDERIQNEISKPVIITWYFTGVIVFVYFALKGTGMETAMVDSSLVVLLQNASGMIWKYAAVAAASIVLIIYTAVVLWNKKKHIRYKKLFVIIFSLYCIFFLLLNAVQLPYRMNKKNQGKAVANEAVQLQKYLDSEDYEDVVYILYNESNYYCMSSAYLNKDCRVVDQIEQLSQVERGRVMVSCRGDLDNIDTNWKETYKTDHMTVYMRQ